MHAKCVELMLKMDACMLCVESMINCVYAALPFRDRTNYRESEAMIFDDKLNKKII